MTEKIISIVSLLTAIVSVYYAFRSNRLSKRAILISEQEFINKQSKFQLYLVDNYRYLVSDKKLLLFNLSINNLSDNKNSFKARAEIEFIRDDNSVALIIIEHNSSLIKEIPKSDLSIFENDIRLEERSVQTKWLIFEQPSNLFDKYTIEKYTIKVSDVQDNEKQVEAHIIKNIQL